MFLDANYGNWLEEDSTEHRWVSLKIPIENPLSKVKEGSVREKQTILKKNPGVVYVVLHETNLSEDIPYGDTFKNISKFCLTRYGDGKSRLRSFSGIEFLKSTFVKYVIKTAAARGMTNYHTVLNNCISQEIKRIDPSKTVEDGAQVDNVHNDNTELNDADPKRHYISLKNIAMIWRLMVDFLRFKRTEAMAFLLCVSWIFFAVLWISHYDQREPAPFRVKFYSDLQAGCSNWKLSEIHLNDCHRLFQLRTRYSSLRESLRESYRTLDVLEKSIISSLYCLWMYSEVIRNCQAENVESRYCKSLIKDLRSMLGAQKLSLDRRPLLK